TVRDTDVLITYSAEDIPPPPEPPRPSAEELAAYAESLKDAALVAGVQYGPAGEHIALTDGSRADIGGMGATAGFLLMGMSGEWPAGYAQGWITVENGRVPLPTPEDGFLLATAIGPAYSAIVNKTRAIKDQVAAGTITTTAEIDTAF